MSDARPESLPASHPPSPLPTRSGRHGLAQPTGRQLWTLSLLALGIVYGDIGTSPLYAVNECFAGDHAVPAAVPGNVLGVLSLITWSLILAISVKYLALVLRADNRGEGGILALSSLVSAGRSGRAARVLAILGLFGACFLYSDGIITPAISVLSAIEGLEIAAPGLTAWVVPITLAIIVALFVFQRRGTAGIGVVFGPVTVLYFVVIAVLGAAGIVHEPAVLAALDPRQAVAFFARNGMAGYLVLGAVFLVITGGEALSADLGHFGRRPIRLAWFGLVLPALLLNYYGQGALLLHDPATQNAYYQLAPAWAQLPLVVLSAAATVIASQAIISGTFSLTAQAMQLGYCPRLAVLHTSATTIGQIYLPTINWTLMLACLGVVVAFGSSTNLAAAYGMAIAVTMIVTSVLFWFIARDVWRWPLAVAAPVTALFLGMDGAFFGANLAKIAHGGWFPLLVTAAIFTLMSTWKAGRQRLGQRLQHAALPLERFLAELERRAPLRVPGTAVFMAGDPSFTPGSLLHNLKHNHVLHERVVVLTVRTEAVPTLDGHERCQVTARAHGLISMTMRFGFKERPDVPAVLARAPLGVAFEPLRTSYFLGRETILPAGGSRWPGWRRRIFSWMSRNSLNAAAFFSLPPNRVVELGMHIEL
jgi:KUP system potassium uptake protein